MNEYVHTCADIGMQTHLPNALPLRCVVTLSHPFAYYCIVLYVMLQTVPAVVPDVFKGLLDEVWFPFTQIPPMSELITLFLDLLDTTDPNTMHKQICEYLTEIYG